MSLILDLKKATYDYEKGFYSLFSGKSRPSAQTTPIHTGVVDNDAGEESIFGLKSLYLNLSTGIY